MNAQLKPLDDQSINVNGKRLWDSLMEMAKIGATPKGGVCRLALTDLDKQGRDLFVQLGEGSGLHGQRRPDGQRVHAPRGHATLAACRSSPARTPTRSRPAAASTASTACSAGSK